MSSNSNQMEKPPAESAINKENGEASQEDMKALEESTQMIEKLTFIEKGTLGKIIHKKKRLTLTPDAVRSFLEHHFEMILADKEVILKFLKCLFISKSFFNSAHRYSIYCLGATYRSDDVVLRVTDLSLFKSPSLKGTFKFSGAVALPYQEMSLFMSMLKPNYFFMTFNDLTFSSETVMKTVSHLNFACGKIALMLTGSFQKRLSLLLDDQFSCRKLDFLQCSSDFLVRSKVKLKVAHYIPAYPITDAQLSKILSHDLDFLSCVVDDDFINKLAGPPSSDPCNSLKWIHITCNQHCDSLMAFLGMVKDNCLKLRTIEIGHLVLGNANIIGIFTADDIMDQVIYAEREIQKVVEKCRPLTSRLEITSVTSMFYNPISEFSCDWINRAKTLNYFKNSIHEESNAPFFNVCQLSSKFDDGFLELDHKTKVNRLS